MKMISRRCLACDAVFLSWGPANRLCRYCRRANGVEEHIPGTQDTDADGDLSAFLRRRHKGRARPRERQSSGGAGC